MKVQTQDFQESSHTIKHYFCPSEALSLEQVRTTQKAFSKNRNTVVLQYFLGVKLAP